MVKPDSAPKLGPESLVSVEKTEDSFKLKFHEDVLPRILEGYEKLPVAVISIVGKTRSGKSFFLNYVLRFFESINKNDAVWMTLTLENEFESAGGADAVTSGIFIWNRPFIFPIKGKDTVVLLVDVMGTEDLENDVSLAMSLFAFSTMISSLQILNVKENFDQSTIEVIEFILGLSTAFAKGVGEGSNDNVPFQSMLVLVRDWVHKNPKHGLHRCLDIWMNQNIKVKPDIKKKLEALLLCFRETNTFLLPYPGKEIREGSFSNNPDIRNDTENSQFLDALKECILFMQSETMLLPFERSGVKMVCGQYIDYAKRSFEAVEPSHFIPKSPLDVCAEMSEIAIIQECVRKFKDAMEIEEGGENVVYTDSDLSEKFEIAKLEATLEFERHKRNVKSESAYQKHERELGEKIDSIYNQMKIHNSAIKDSAKNKAKAAKERAFKVFKGAMEIRNLSSLNSEQLSRIYENAKRKSWKEYVSAKKDIKIDSVYNKYEKKTENEFSAFFDKVKGETFSKQVDAEKIEKVALREALTHFSAHVKASLSKTHQAIWNLNSLFSNQTKENVLSKDQLEEVLREAEKVAEQKFNKYERSESLPQIRYEYLSKFKKDILNKRKEIEQHNDLLKMKSQQNLQLQIFAYVEKYSAKMKNEVSNEKTHDKASKEVIQAFLSDNKRDNESFVLKEVSETLKEKINEKFDLECKLEAIKDNTLEVLRVTRIAHEESFQKDLEKHGKLTSDDLDEYLTKYKNSFDHTVEEKLTHNQLEEMKSELRNNRQDLELYMRKQNNATPKKKKNSSGGGCTIL